MISVDVIILSWDRLDDTLAAIRSSLSQTGVDLKVIIVDQGSKPESLAQLKEFCATDPRITLQCNTVNNGVTGGRNQAAFLGTGKYIVALDNDAEFADENQLARMAEIMEAEPKTGVLAFRIKVFGTDQDDRSSWPYNENLEEWSTKRFKTVRFVGAGQAIRREVFEKVGGYDERIFFLHEEVDLSQRIINARYEIYYEPSIIIGHKVSGEHRVSWSGKRYYYDVRNKTYIHIKHGTRLPTFLFHTFLLVMKGIKSGFASGTLKGLWAAILMFPDAIKERLHNPYTKKTSWSVEYMESCSPLRGWSAWDRIKYRFGQANKKVGS